MNFRFPKGVEIDSALNMNEDEGFGKQLKKWGPLAGAAALAAFGIPGLFPGLLNAGGAAAGAGAGAAAAGTGSGAGVSTGAAAAGGIGTWLRPLLQYGVPAAAGLVGQHLQNRADERATDIQADYLNRALEVEKEKEAYTRGERANYLERLRPYNEAGTAATSRASTLLTTGYRPEVSRETSGPTVRLRAPDGSIGEVSAAMADHYLQRGATRI